MNLRPLLITLLATLTPAAADTAAPATATNALGLDLYRLESVKQQGNLLLSPYSIQSALSMTLGGAEGVTKAEMAKVLHLSRPDAAGQDFADLRAVLEKAAADSAQMAEQARKYGGKFEPLQLRVANRLFGNEDAKFEPDFLARTKTDWAAPLEQISFSKPDRARTKINSWVEDQTRERIKDLIPEGGVTAETRLVLVNALYFKAAWKDDFNKALTANLPFLVNGSSPAPVPTMYQQENYGYTKEAGFTAVTVPYTGMALHLLIVLPDANDGLPALEKTLTPAQLAKLARASMAKEVKLFLPKFKMEPGTLALADHLKTRGMKSAFDEPKGSADFSRMAARTPEDYLAISEVFHKTFIALDEEGTEAAAATAVAMPLPSAIGPEPEKPVEVRVDHPFLFAIQHRESGVCLFLGRVTDPRSAP